MDGSSGTERDCDHGKLTIMIIILCDDFVFFQCLITCLHITVSRGRNWFLQISSVCASRRNLNFRRNEQICLLNLNEKISWHVASVFFVHCKEHLFLKQIVMTHRPLQV